MTHPLARAIRRALAAHRDPVKAPQMQRYMKSAMPFYGVSAPVQKQLWRDLVKYSPEIAALGRAARQRMRRALPGWSEFVYDNYNALGFGFAPTTRPSDAVFSVVLYPKWVRLFFLQNGPDLQDPEHLLSGTGKRVRSLVLPTAAHLETPAVRALMRQAISLADAGAVLPGRVQTTIRSVSARQRPRRPRA